MWIIAALGLVLTSCDNDLVVTAPWKDIPVTYGILTPVDSIHFVRIEKAFLDPNTSAEEIARIPDSLYYDNLDAAIVDVSAGMRYQLEEVDATLEGYPRDEGVFAETPNILYKVLQDDIKLTSGRAYRLEFSRGDNLPLVTAEVEQVEPATIKRPVPNTELRFNYDNDFKVLWEQADNGFFYDVSLLINYDEWPTGDPLDVEALTLEWELGRNITGNEAEVLGIEFYEYLASQLEADPGISRRLIGIDCLVRSGGEELYTFRTIQLANSGITGAGGELPTFTNLSEGLGLLTTSNLDAVQDLGLHPETVDSLRNGQITGDLNFR